MDNFFTGVRLHNESIKKKPRNCISCKHQSVRISKSCMNNKFLGNDMESYCTITKGCVNDDDACDNHEFWEINVRK